MDRPESDFADRESGVGEPRQPPARGTGWGSDTARALGALARATSDPVLVVALGDRRVLEVNDAFSREVGRHPADLAGLPVEHALPRVNAPAIHDLLDALRLHRVADAEIELLVQGGPSPRRALGMSTDGETAFIRVRALRGGGARDEARTPTDDARAEAGTPTEPIDLRAAFGDVLPVLHRFVHEGTAIELRLPGAPMPVLAERGELDQLLLGLAAGVRDAVPAGGTMAIEVESCALDEAAAAAVGASAGAGAYAALRARDRDAPLGGGDAAPSLRPGNVTEAVGRLGGAVSTASGAGGAITVYLPLGRRGPRAGPAAGARRAVVLYAEDEAPLRLLGRRILERGGFEVYDAASGEEALHVAQSADVDVLVTDLMLPGIRGRELAAAVAAHRPGVGVLFVSGFAVDDPSLGDLLDAGALYLEKPFSPGALVDRVAELATRKAQRH